MRILIGILLAAAVCGCGRDPGPELVLDTLPVVYTDPEAEFPRIRYGDGLVSVNDRCIVRKVKLNLRMPPVYVNGRPVGFC